jgi:S-DNA-T family DNA segregation ATPase FtsK/SpoIIIE
MARASKRAKNAETAVSNKSEVLGILIFLVATLLGLALFSHNAADPSFNTVSPFEPTNFVGKVGAYFSEALFMVLGYSAYLIPLLLLIMSWLQFTERPLRFKLSQIAGLLLFVSAVSAGIRVLANGNQAFESGGVIGMLIGEFFFKLFGTLGASVVFLGALFIALVLTFDLRFKSVGLWMWNKAKAFSALIGEYLDKRADTLGKDKPENRDAEPMFIGSEKSGENIDNDLNEPVIQSLADDLKNPKANPEQPIDPIINGSAPVQANVKVRSQEGAPEPSAKIEYVGFKGDYTYPPIDLLIDHGDENATCDRMELLEQSRVLEEKLLSFKISGKVVEVHPGPVITMFEFEPAAGVKVSQIANREDDLAMALRAQSIRIVAPIPGKGAVGIEVPNRNRQVVSLKELIGSEKFQKTKGSLPVVFGKDIGGGVRVADLATMPHLLVAGTTGSGKSVFVNSIICSLLYRCSPDYLRMLMVDPKMLELSDYASIPHLLYPVVTDPRKAAVILRWAVTEMEDRYRKMADMGVRNIDNYNNKIIRIQEGRAKLPAVLAKREDEPLEKLPFILIIIDELSDLMIVAAKEVEESITRLAQMARAAGIHLLMATQRPSVDVITGVIKANFPARISFKVSSKIDSRTILDGPGAHSLLGKGDMLFMPPAASQIERIHGALVTETEIQDVVDAIVQTGGPQFDENIIRAGDKADDPGAMSGFSGGAIDDEEDLIEQAWEIIRAERKASISYIQRRMKVGYNKAARIIEALEARGFISASDGTSRPREIIGLQDE